MANKNDLRYIKTEELIRNTYMALRKTERAGITVTKLCQQAKIHKTTFYMHFENIDDLHGKLCGEIISNMLCDIPEVDHMLKDIPAFVHSIKGFFSGHAQELQPLFPDLKETVDYIESAILKRYIIGNVDSSMEAKIRFCIGGALRQLCHANNEESVTIVIELIRKVFAQDFPDFPFE